VITSKCPECSAAMEEGFIPDYSHAQILQLAWQRGPAEPSKFLGMSKGIKVHAENQLKVTAKRCTRCGYLKLYALPQVE